MTVEEYYNNEKLVDIVDDLCLKVGNSLSNVGITQGYFGENQDESYILVALFCKKGCNFENKHYILKQDGMDSYAIVGEDTQYLNPTYHISQYLGGFDLTYEF